MAPKSEFKYQRRSADQWRAKATESAGNFDNYVLDSVKKFKPHDGQNRIRILPPTWDGADDWNLPVYIHYGVGADETTYLCPRQMKGKDCPICEESDRLNKEGDQDEAKNLKAKRRSGCWIIDRKDDQGPKFWAMPFGVGRDATNQALDEETKEVLELDHPTEGYDVLFLKEGTGNRTKYSGVKLSRRATPIYDDKKELQQVLAYLQENPLTDILKIYDSAYLEKVFSGKVSKADKDNDDDDDDRRSSSKSRSRYDDDEDDGEQPRARKKASKYDDDDEDEDPPFATSDDDDDDEEEERPKSKSKSSALLDDDDDEDEQPRGRRSSKVKDEEEDDDDEDEEEERPRTRRRIVKDDEDDDDDDEPRSSVTRRLERSSGKK